MHRLIPFLAALLLIAVASIPSPAATNTSRPDPDLDVADSNPQPGLDEIDEFGDSLTYYDPNELASYQVSESNYYSLVRFTPDYDFELQGLGIFGRAQILPDSLHFYVYEDAAGQPGQLLLDYIDYNITAFYISYPRSYVLSELPQVEFLDLPAGLDFWVSVKIPGRNNLSSPWAPYFDFNETGARNWTGANNPAIPTNPQQGDWGIGALGQYVIGDADLEVMSVASADQAYHYFEPASVDPQILIRNNGPGANSAASCQIEMINLDSGQTAFTLNYPVPTLSPGTETTLDLNGQTIPVPNGAWMLRATVMSVSDNVPGNNSGDLLQQAGASGTAFRYDDGTNETTIFSAAGVGYGNVFYPPNGSAMIQALEFVTVQAGEHYTVQLFAYDDGELFINQSHIATEGVNTVAINPMLFSEPVVVTLIGDAGLVIPLDQSWPQVIDNPAMPLVAVTSDWGDFTPYTNGTFMVRAKWATYAGPDLSFPDEPFDLGQTQVNTTLMSSVPVTNHGQSSAQISSITSNDNNLDVLVDTWPVVIGAGETVEIPVSWSPLLAGDDLMTLTFDHNDPTITDPYQLDVVATAFGLYNVNVEPVNGLPLTVPRGGSFDFDLAIQIAGIQSPGLIDLWTFATLPNGNDTAPLQSVSLLALPWMNLNVADITVNIPGNAPLGSYSWNVSLGNLPNQVFATAWFDFEVIDAPTVAGSGDWSVHGLDRVADVAANSNSPVAVNLPDEFQLGAAYPNPFNPTAQIDVTLPRAAELNLTVHDITGRQVTELSSGSQSAGTHSFTIDGRNWASGIYFVRAVVPGELNTVRKLTLLK